MEMRLKYLSPANRIREKRTYSIQLEERLENRMPDDPAGTADTPWHFILSG